MKIEKLVIRVKRYIISSSNLARHIYFIEEYLEDGDFNNIGVTNDFDSVLMITQPYRNVHMKIDYIIEETSRDYFNHLLDSLKTLSEPNSTKYIYKGVKDIEQIKM